MADLTQIAPNAGVARQPSRDAGASAIGFRGLAEAHGEASDAPARLLADWVRDFLTRPHPDLGRPGHVCPFTAQAARLDSIRIGIAALDGSDRAALRAAMKAAMREFEAIPCARAGRQFRTVIVGFPNCRDAAGIAALKQVQRAMRHHSTVFGKMIGLFGPESQHEGLVNPAFRSQRSPIPALAIRMLVEKDAPFVVRNPLLVPIYLLSFPLGGPRRLLASVRARSQTRVRRL